MSEVAYVVQPKLLLRCSRGARTQDVIRKALGDPDAAVAKGGLCTTSEMLSM